MSDLKDFVPEIPLRRLRKITKQFDGMDDSTPISFEFMMTPFFPSVWNNIQDYCRANWEEGFKAGRGLLNDSKTDN